MNPVVCAARIKGTNTSQAAEALIKYVQDSDCTAVVLCVGPTAARATAEERDALLETNMPVMAAVATYTIPAAGACAVVMDGLFLSAARLPRAAEVTQVLDAAAASGKVKVVLQPVQTTHRLEPAQAASLLLGAPSVPLNTHTRSAFFKLLSPLDEAQIASLKA